MRKSIDGLAQMVSTAMGMSPMSGHVSVFIGRRRDRATLLVWDRHGFWVLYKRLEADRFIWPDEAAVPTLTVEAELAAGGH